MKMMTTAAIALLALAAALFSVEAVLLDNKVDVNGAATYEYNDTSLVIALNVKGNTSAVKGVVCDLQSISHIGLLVKNGADYRLESSVLSHDMLMQLESVAFVECAVLFVDTKAGPVTFVVDLIRGPLSLSRLLETGPITRTGPDGERDVTMLYLRSMMKNSSVTSLAIGLIALGILFWFLIPALIIAILCIKDYVKRRQTQRFKTL